MVKGFTAALVVVFVAACKGPPVGSKVPQPDPRKVAGAAAAIAGLATLVAPDLAGRTPERQDAEGRRGSKGRRETVPADVLDRLDARERGNEDEERAGEKKERAEEKKERAGEKKERAGEKKERAEEKERAGDGSERRAEPRPEESAQ